MKRTGNNKVFIAADIRNEAVKDVVRGRVESRHFFDRYGDACIADRFCHFGFASVVPGDGGRWFFRLVGCSFVYFPCGWHRDRVGRRCMMWSELLGKKVIFEEDSRCR